MIEIGVVRMLVIVPSELSASIFGPWFVKPILLQRCSYPQFHLALLLVAAVDRV
jgi:predicted DNA repair protein MutK